MNDSSPNPEVTSAPPKGGPRKAAVAFIFATALLVATGLTSILVQTLVVGRVVKAIGERGALLTGLLSAILPSLSARWHPRRPGSSPASPWALRVNNSRERDNQAGGENSRAMLEHHRRVLPAKGRRIAGLERGTARDLTPAGSAG